MSAGEFEQVVRINAPAVVAAMAAGGGPAVELVERLAGGEVGAWLVRWPDSHHGVLTWLPQPPHGSPPRRLDLTQQLMAVARGAGVPVPTWEAIVDLGALGTAVLQQRAIGVPPKAIGEGLIAALVDMAETRRGLLAGIALSPSTMPLYLNSPGPGFCLHEPLRAFSPTTAALLERIEAVGALYGEYLTGDDVVHYDYHPGNVLVDPDRPDKVNSIIDWGGACPGRVELDLAILAFDLTWRTPGRRQERVEQHLYDCTDPTTFAMVWAHASLRLLDWTVRHYPHDIDHWSGVAERHLLRA